MVSVAVVATLKSVAVLRAKLAIQCGGPGSLFLSTKAAALLRLTCEMLLQVPLPRLLTLQAGPLPVLRALPVLHARVLQ